MIRESYTKKLLNLGMQKHGNLLVKSSSVRILEEGMSLNLGVKGVEVLEVAQWSLPV